MAETSRRAALLHYSAPPVIGGVESVMLAHLRLLADAGWSTALIAGRGQQDALPPGTDWICIPELDSQHPQVLEISRELEQGRIPPSFEPLVGQLAETLAPALQGVDALMVHNIFTKHFNLPLTAALVRLLDQGRLPHCIAWCHDLTWTSPASRSRVFPGHPWDLLRTYRADVTYAAVSQERQREMVDLLGYPAAAVHVVYNGVDAAELLALSPAGRELIERLGLWQSDLNLLMPVRVTRAKNIELGIQVAAELQRRGVRLRLVVTGPPDPHDCGNMDYFQGLLRLREQLGVERDVRFVYESGPQPAQPWVVEMPVVAELFRMSDALFMPSHREGFGMPVLEAGLAGIPVFCSDRVPAGNEIGGGDVIRFAPEADAGHVADLIQAWMETSAALRLRQRVRRGLTWRTIFEHDILPLLDRGAP